MLSNLRSFVHGVYRIPLLGYFAQLLVATVRLPRFARYHASLLSEQQNQLQHLAAQLEQTAHREQVASRLLADYARLLEEQRAGLAELQHESRTRYSQLRDQLMPSFHNRMTIQMRELAHKQQTLDEKVEQAEETSRHALQMSLELQRPFVFHEDRSLDSLYVSFEDRFRGSREEIRERLKIYVPEVRNLAETDRPVLDLGCGRGEWLELLHAEGIEARGVDINLLMVQQCKDLGLDAIHGDLLDHLGSLESQSVAAITLHHVVEHLPWRVLIKLLDESLRVLVKGGLIILETPNPSNVLVGSSTFYLDPTHRNPIPSPCLKFIAEARGFAHSRVWELNPYASHYRFEGSAFEKRLSDLLYGPQDYAVLTVRP